MDERLKRLLEESVRRGASDLHVSAGHPAYVRVAGELASLGGDALGAEAREMIVSLLNESQREALTRHGSADVGFSLGEGVRFRGHVYCQGGVATLAARRLEERFRSLGELNLPASLGELGDLRDGLVLLTGPTGSGKSTTLATLIDQINGSRSCHIVTIEDPIEYVHRNRGSLVHQREVGRDVGGFAEAVRDALREDPDVVLVGEMRDVETMRAAIMVAETGHLVFSTLHCGSAVGALDRMIGAFAAHERDSLCQQLSMTLRAVVAQHLLPRADRTGRVPAVEILRVTRAVAHLVRNHKSEQIATVMEGGAQQGMRTLEQSLSELVAAGLIDRRTAGEVADNDGLLERRLQASPRGGTPRGRQEAP